MSLLLNGCAELLELLKQTQIEKPNVRFSQVRLSDLSFDKADLMFSVEISNPNNVGINLSGFNYDFLLNENSFVSGNNSDPLQIQPNETSTIDLPVSLGFKKLYDTYNSLRNSDSVAYSLKMDLGFNLPVLGVTRVPLQTSGTFPTMKMPSVKLQALKLENLSFSGADLRLKVMVDNPNGWSMMLNTMNYALNINGSQWLQGTSNQSMGIEKHQENIVEIPFSLNFFEMGSSIYNLLTGDKSLSYTLTGAADMQSSLPLVGSFKLPFDKSGQIDILK
jgi:LEA14-like dessication related protein